MPAVLDRCLAPPFVSWYKRSSWSAVQSADCQTQPWMNQETRTMDSRTSAYIDLPLAG
jgi:hypothetical protein